MDLARKDWESNWTLSSVCRIDFGEEGELVGCEELARFLQMTYCKRRTVLVSGSKG